MFRDQYVRVPFDLSAVLWIVTATDPDAIPEAVRNRLEVIELPGYTEQEKLAIAERHLLKRPFDASVPGPAAWLAPEPAAPSPAAGPDGPVPIVVVEREVSSPAGGRTPPRSSATPRASTLAREPSASTCADCTRAGMRSVAAA